MGKSAVLLFAPIILAGALVISFLLLLTPTSAHAATSTVIYQSDFSTDPQWTTDQPENFYWDSTRETLFARMHNTPPLSGGSPNRYFYHKTTLNPTQSFELTFDMQILSIVSSSSVNGVSVFGLYGDSLKNFFTSTLEELDTKGTVFALRLMTLDARSRYIFNELIPVSTSLNDFRRAVIQPFSLETWYTVTLRYHAPEHTYSFEIKERDTGVIFFSSVIDIGTTVPDTTLKNIGMSGNPEGIFGTNLSQRIGYSEYLIDNVKLTQTYDETYTEPSSVLFLPGIQASRLYTDGILGTEDQLWEPNINGDVAQLAMTEDGESVEDVYTRDIVDSALGVFDVYKGFSTYMNTLKNQRIISDWVPYAYDWRYAVSEVIEQGTQYEEEVRSLIATVENLARNNNSHVTIIAHSNGGLLAKALVARLEAEGRAHLIDRIILIASPQLGTPKAIGSILHGYDQEQLHGWLVNDETAREAMRNMPGVYGLVPSEEYLTRITGPVVSFDTASTTEPFTAVYGTTIDSSDELGDFMAGILDGRPEAERVNEASHANEAMQEDARLLHRDSLDTWIAPPHIQVIEIVGVGLDTVKGFQYQEFDRQACTQVGGPTPTVCVTQSYYEPVPQLTLYGDETVVAKSAEAYAGDKVTYYVDLNEATHVEGVPDVKHSNITELSALQEFTRGLLQDSVASVPFIYGTEPSFDTEREMISIHSPVVITLTDTLGNVVGREDPDSAPVTDSPGSSYFEIGGATYIIVPNSLDYDIRIEGTEEGSYTLVRRLLVGENSPELLSKWDMATTTPTMIASFSKRLGVYSDLTIDYDGNGTVDEVMTLEGEPPTYALYESLRAIMTALNLLKVSERNWLIHATERAERTGVRRGDGSSGVVRIFSQIDDRLITYKTDGRVSDTEYTLMKGIMQEIMSR